MAHENREKLYDDWDEVTFCSFKNVFNPDMARRIGKNIQQILGISHFKTDDMARQAPETFDFTCTRRQANLIRDRLSEVTTSSHANVWFSTANKHFHYIDRARSMIDTVPMKIKDYPVSFYFGSMYSYGEFNRHTEDHPAIHDISIKKWRNEPETIRIMSKNKLRQIFIPIRWIQRQILVNLKGQPCVVFMLKHSVKMKRKTTKEGQEKLDRFCNLENDNLTSLISKSSDLLLMFAEPQHTCTFLGELMNDGKGHKKRFTINFVTLEQTSMNNNNRPQLVLPSTASHKQHYALQMLYSMGYVFQDKYSPKIHEEFIANLNESFNEMCYYLKEKLEENHCYRLKFIFQDYRKYLQEKEKEKEKEESTNNTCPFTIGCVSLTPLRVVYQPMISSYGNRVLRDPQFGGEENFLLVHIREEDNQSLKDFDASIRIRLKNKMMDGIKVMGKTYRLFGSSTGQMKEMSFWFVDLQDRKLEDSWKLLGNFSSIKNVASYVARIGLFFSTTRPTGITFRYVDEILPHMKYVVTSIEDVEIKEKNYNFTDGIGKMSWKVAALIAKRLNIPLQCKEDIPSAYQVRIAGCKGMLAIDPESNMDDIYIKVRPSMEKFDSDNWDLEICEYSRPLGLKFNNQVIMLLSELGNADGVFEAYQNRSIHNWAEQNEIERNRKMQYASAADDLLKNKFLLPLNEGRNMFGVVDETQTLNEGQVFIQYKNYDPKAKEKYTVVKGEVIVAKMPCLHPGDVRKFTAVDVPKLRECIRDCIAFPMKGSRPHPNELSGSDLDGDQYWVYWGRELKIRKMEDPLSYTPAQKIKLPTISSDMVIDHIVDSFGTGSQGLICDVHLALAASRDYGVKSEECKKLAELFARAVDAPKTGETIDLGLVYKLRAKVRGYPYFMRKYDQPITETNCVLNKLFLAAREKFFENRDPISRAEPAPARHHAKSSSANSRTGENRRGDGEPIDEDFLKWLSSLDDPVLFNSAAAAPLIKGRPSSAIKPRASIDVIPKESVANTSEQVRKEHKKQTAASKKPKEDEDEEDETTSMESITAKGRRSSNAVKPKETKEKPLASSASCTNDIVNRNIIFNGMTSTTNRIKWTQHNNELFMVDLDTKNPGNDNGVDKLVQNLLESAKAETLSKDAKLTLAISWGELSLKLPQTMDNSKPKNIKELIESIKQNNDVKFSFDAATIEHITEKNEPSHKSAAEFVLVCKLSDDSSEYVSLIFNEKKVLKSFSISTPWWIGCIRRSEELADSLYDVRLQQNEIDSKHDLFQQYLNNIFKQPNSTSILKDTSPRLTIATELLRPNIRVISLRRVTRYSFSTLHDQNFGGKQFDTLKDLEYDFFHVINISTEKINGKVTINETIEFHAEQIQLTKKHETNLKELLSTAETFFM